MKYSKEFKSLLDLTTETYIGHGNPNAKVLILGQEPAADKNEIRALDNRNDYERSILENKKHWGNNVVQGIGFENLEKCCTLETMCNYNPLFPYNGQKFIYRRKSGKKDENGIDIYAGQEGTAPTWCNYQKLINKIALKCNLPEWIAQKREKLTFHSVTFSTDMSREASTSRIVNPEGVASVIARATSMFNTAFFKTFPVIIAAVGRFPDKTYGHDYFANIFNVKLISKRNLGKLWIDVYENDECLLIHCPQFSARIADSFIEEIASIVSGFVKERSINIHPLE